MERKKPGLLQLYTEKRGWLLPLLGALLVSLIALPYVLLGEGSYVEIHDQLDGEVLNYIYQAKYLFRQGPIREFMSGMDKASMLPPAPFGVLFFAVLPPFAAFALMHELELLTAFFGMYFLGKRLQMSEEIAFLLACLFSYLPFYPVYGLSAYGQPLLLLCLLLLIKGEKQIGSLTGLVLVAGFSSFSLIGYAFVGFGFPAVLFLLGKKKKKEAARLFLGIAFLFGTYLLLNLDLLRMLGGGGYVTHRSEMVLYPQKVRTVMRELFLQGGAYSKVYSPVILLLGLAVWTGLGMKRAGSFHLKNAKRVFGLILAGTVLSALWNSSVICSLREGLGGPFPYFQADRIYWCFPFLWMLLLGFLLQSIWEEIFSGLWKLRVGALAVLAFCLLLCEAGQIFKDQPLNKNLRLLLQPGYERVTWEGFYMEDVFAQADKVLTLEPGEKVVSLGIYPAVALYHGYPCADGYSNNYDVAYKHLFRSIMAQELSLNEEARRYYDEWGNRVYLCGRPYGNNAFVGKDQTTPYETPYYDLTAMQKMGIRYLFSAAEVKLPSEPQEGPHLKPVSGSPFVTDGSYYALWIYEIAEGKE